MNLSTPTTPSAEQAPAEDAPEAAPPAAAGEQAARSHSGADCADELRERFPALFGHGYKPVKLKIQADIQQRAPGVFSKQALSAFFRRYTGTTGYLTALTHAKQRFDLDGQPAGDLSDEHRKAAVDELARRRALHRAKIDQAEEGRRLRASLLRDFERTTLTPANFCALKGVAPDALEALLAAARREAQERPPGPDMRRDRRPPDHHGAQREGNRRPPRR